MNIIVPIIFVATLMGLFIPRITPRHWGLLAFWISLVIAWQFLKH